MNIEKEIKRIRERLLGRKNRHADDGEENWVTINGTHVLIDDEGVAQSGGKLKGMSLANTRSKKSENDPDKAKSQEANPGKPKAKHVVFKKEDFTQDRQDFADYFTDQQEADDLLREKCGEVWREATEKEKDCVCEYTGPDWYSDGNDALRDFEAGRIDVDDFTGHDKVMIENLTSLIDKSECESDIWVKKVLNPSRTARLVNMDSYSLMHNSEAELNKAIVGKPVVEAGFCSTSAVDDNNTAQAVKLRIYVPKGAKGLYCEPFSKYGLGPGRSWDGVKKQVNFGDEMELLLQRGCVFMPTKVRVYEGDYIENGYGRQVEIEMLLLAQKPKKIW